MTSQPLRSFYTISNTTSKIKFEVICMPTLHVNAFNSHSRADFSLNVYLPHNESVCWELKLSLLLFEHLDYIYIICKMFHIILFMFPFICMCTPIIYSYMQMHVPAIHQLTSVQMFVYHTMSLPVGSVLLYCVPEL